jgi:transketolase
MRDTLLESIFEAMKKDSSIFLVSADFGSPVIDKIKSEKADRFINVGIAEQNLINVSAGLALEGFKVFAYAIAPFITMRCFEQIRVNLALLSKVRPINVNLIGVGAGYSYVVSGPTHQCYEDITLMRSMPNMQILSISDEVMAKSISTYCLDLVGPKYIRLDAQILPIIYQNKSIDFYEGFFEYRKGSDALILSTGYMTHTAIKIANLLKKENINLGIIDLFNITHFNKEGLNIILRAYNKIISMEEGFSGRGGMDSMIFNHLNEFNLNLQLLNIGVNPEYRFEIGSRETLHEEVGIGANICVEKIKQFISKTKG